MYCIFYENYTLILVSQLKSKRAILIKDVDLNLSLSPILTLLHQNRGLLMMHDSLILGVPKLCFISTNV